MASLIKSRELKIIQFFCPSTKVRKSIRLGKINVKAAEAIKAKVEEIISSKLAGIPWSEELSKWIAAMPDVLARKLGRVGLLPNIRQNAVLEDFISDYLKKRTDTKASTRRALLTTKLRIVEFFGAKKAMREVTQADADDFKAHLLTKYAKATAGRTLRAASQFFGAAKKAKLISENPFSEIKFPSEKNEKRMFFVTREMFEQLLAACPDHQWRTILALSRLGGLRVFSEIAGLKWSDIDWARGKMLVHSPKTEHHEGKESRWVPLFDDGLLQILEEGREQAKEGEVFVVSRYRESTQNLRTTFTKIIQKAGLKPWPKLFANMRSTRQTELARLGCPIHLLSAWIGNTEKVMRDHYLQVNDDDYANASQWTPKKSGAKSGAQPVHFTMQQGADSSGTESNLSPQVLVTCGDMRFGAESCENYNGRHRIRTYDFHRVRMAL